MPTSQIKRRTMRGRAGFTLIELLIVLAIVALTVSLVVPPLSAALGVGRLRVETTEASTGLREARSTAMISGRVVDFIVEGGRVWRIGDEVHRLPNGLMLSLEVPPLGIAGDGRALIRFFPTGRATGGRIVIAEGDRRRTLAVDWLTGRVREE